MSFLQLDGLVKRFGAFTAVDDVSLDVERGEFVSLLGPSGCGKTTTLQMIAGFESPSAGRVVIDGRDVTAGNPRDVEPFVFMFLFNNNKGQHFAGTDPFAGDIAALVVYRDVLSRDERDNVRRYFDRVYELDLQAL